MPTIDFTSGYRDSTQGATLKALALRRAELSAALGQRKPRRIDDPWQGAAEVADTISGGIREGRLANQEAAGRARFAELLAGGLAPDEIGEAMGLDPETTMKYQERTWATEDRDKTAAQREKELTRGHGWDVDAATARVTAEQEQAAALAKTQAESQGREFTHSDTADATKHGYDIQDAETLAKTQAAQNLAEDPVAKAGANLKAGNITQAEHDAIVNKETYTQPVKPGDLFTPGQAEADKLFAKELGEWETSGGANAAKSIADVGNAIHILETKGPTGLMAGIADKTLPEYASKWLNPNADIARSAIRNTIQQTLRETLGAQFTEKEGEALMNRAFDINQSPQENIARAKAILQQVKTIADAKQEKVNWWHTHGATTSGYQGKPIDTTALANMFPDDQGAAAAGGAPDLSGVSEEELKRAIAEGRK